VREGTFRSDLYYRLCVVKIDVPPLRERTKDIPILVYDFIEKLNQESEKKILGVTDEAMDLLLKYHWPGNVRELKNFLESTIVLSPDRMIERKDVEQYVEKQYQTVRHLPVITGKSVETAEHELIYQAILSLRSEIINLRKVLRGEKEFPKGYRVDLEDQWEKEIKYKPVEQNLTLEEMERDLIEKTLRETRGNRKKASKVLGIGERTLYRKIDKYGLREVR
jgi:DNA-binding NtrC family response regulator